MGDILINAKEAKIILNLLKRIPQTSPPPTKEEIDIINKLMRSQL